MKYGKFFLAPALALLLFPVLVSAQIGPGLPNLTYKQSELFKTLSTIRQFSVKNPSAAKGLNSAAMHKGYLFVVYGEDSGKPGGGIAFYDISNPRSIKLVHAIDVPDLREAHGFGFHSQGGEDYVAMQSIHGVHIWNITNVLKPFLVKDFRISGVFDSDYDHGSWWVHWQAPYLFVGRGLDGFSVVDATDLANPKLMDIMVDGQPKAAFPITKTGGFKLGPLFVVGNLLVASNMGTGRNPGYSTLDISVPNRPVLLGTDNSTECYSTFFNGNRLYCAGVTRFAGKLVVHDMSDPTAIKKVGESIKAGNRGEYVSVQDGFAHMGLEDRYAKFRLSDFSIVNNSYQLEVGPTGIDAQEGFANVLGNLVLVTDDHSVGSSLIAHQAGPDHNPPVVNMVNPTNGSVNRKPSSRIGVTFTDQIDLQSVGPATFIVRPVGGQALTGWYSSQTNIVNFSPKDPLKANTTYEVVIPKGGIKDYAGNATDETFLSRFSTGGSVVAIDAKSPGAAGLPAFHARAEAAGFSFQIASGMEGPATLVLATLQGGHLRTLNVGDARGQTLHWNGTNDRGEKIKPGIVVATLRTGSTSFSRSLVLP